MISRVFTYCLIGIISVSSFSSSITALEDASTVHTLDELPYSSNDTLLDIRKEMLGGDLPEIMEERGSSDISGTIQSPEVSYASSLIPEDDFMTLLAEQRIFEKKNDMLIPGFITDPFIKKFLSDTSIISSFLDSEDLSLAFSNESFSPEETFEELLPREVSTRLDVKKGIKNRKQVSSSHGSISVAILSGTTISTLSGDVIDSSLIQISSLDFAKKQKAKVKYEKKMKNRGTLKKGQAEAQVEGFEFGLSGIHLLFSKPVVLTIETPNMGEGMVVDLLTMHAGDTDFQTGGLSVSPGTLCDTSGYASMPGSQAVVKNGKITFYTCGASSFTMNPTGGTTGSNDLRIIVGDCAQAQVYYNNQTQLYTGNPAATGCGLPALWAMLRIGGVTYGNGVDGVTATAWSTQTTTGSTNGNTYTATSTMTRVVGALTYTLIIDWSHTAPNKYLTWSYRVIVPATNTANIRFYFANDSAVAGADTNDTGYYTATGGQTIGVYDSVANILSAFRYISGTAWTAYEAGPYATITGRITGGTDFTNTHISSGDIGYGVNWNFGTGANVTYSGTVEWRILPYVAGNVPDLIPGIGSPEGPLTTNLLSQYPITITNAGNLASSGVHTVVLTIPINIVGPSSPFVDNGWSCGAQVGAGVTCTKTTIINTPLGTDTFRIPVTPTLAASGTNVTFNVAISNSGDSNMTNNTAFSTHPVIGAGTNDPGGITGESLWLQANSGTNCTTTGCTITTWANLGSLGAPANAVTGLGTAVHDPTNRINGNATIYLNGASFNTNNTLGLPARANSIFAVTRIGTGGQFLLGTQTVTANARSWTTRPTTDTWMRNASTVYYNGANFRSPNTPAITSTIRQTAGASAGYTDGRTTLTSADATNFTINNIGIGRIENTNSTLTNLAEVIIYPSAISLPQKNRVESYLAIKYGITLDQTVATDYTLSNGVVIWSATGAGIYKNNIASIARDDLSTLNQSRSQSATNTGDIILSKSAIATNRMAITWAHEGSTLSTFTGSDAPFGFQRISREWLFQEKNGDMGTVTISYPALSVPGGFTGILILLTDADGVFATGTTAYTGIYNTGTTTWDFSLDIGDLQYITFAKGVPTDTTPPTITSINIASGTLIPTSNFTLTVGYSDTGSSISPSSFTGRIYAWDSTGATWSLTDIAPSYMSITGTTTTATGQLRVVALPFGKYRFDILISDTAGNAITQSYTYFVDAIIWTVSAPLYPIGSAPFGADTFGSGELIVTIQTVGAGFDLSMIRTTDLTYITDVIPVYSGSTGWGYSQWNGSSFPPIITPHGTTQTLASITKNINTNGQRNTFIYRVKYGVNPNANAPAGDYSGGVSFGLNMTY